MARSKTAPLFALYLGYLLVATFYPFVLGDSSSGPIPRLVMEFLTVKRPAIKDFAQNIVLFIPFGALFYYSLKSAQRSRARVTLAAFGTGCALSLAIEAGQILFDRYPSVSDLIANGLGAGCGAFVASLLPVRMTAVLARSWEAFATSKSLLSCVFLYGTVPLILALLQWPWPNFRTWDWGLSIQIANEATGDRPWLGRIYRVAFYNRALSPAEVASNFDAGFTGNATKVIPESGLVALYTFADGESDRVRDVSGPRDRLDLLITPQSHVTWLRPSGIEIGRPVIIKSEGPATKLVNAFYGRDEISVEAWFAPGNLTQKGPARIVSYSGDTRRQNFMLGQEGAEIVLRLKTVIAGGQALVTNSQVLTREASHVVATYAKGIERLYINGVQYPAVLDVTKDVVMGFAGAKHPIAQIAFSFFYFFPLALFFAIFFASRTNGLMSGLLPPIATAAGLQAVTDIVQALAFDRAVDFPLIGYGLVVAAIGTLFGAGFLKTDENESAKLAYVADNR